MNDVSELLRDPDFVTDFVLSISSTSRHDDGSLIESVDNQKKRGVIQPAPSKDTQFLLEGDKHRQAIKVWSDEYLSTVDKRVPQLGDVICWHCSTFRVTSVKDWSQYGYWQAIAVQLLDTENE